jgi:hypothetical protein
MYRHRLPPGFVLKSDKKKAEEDAKKEKISLEDFLEVEVSTCLCSSKHKADENQRHKLKPPLTPVTPESFAIWKKTRLEKKAAEQEALEKAKTAQRAAGKLTGLSGRALFEVGGELYGDEDDEGEEDWDISRMLATYVSFFPYFVKVKLTDSARKTGYVKKKSLIMWMKLRMASMGFRSMAHKSWSVLTVHRKEKWSWVTGNIL